MSQASGGTINVAQNLTVSGGTTTLSIAPGGTLTKTGSGTLTIEGTQDNGSSTDYANFDNAEGETDFDTNPGYLNVTYATGTTVKYNYL